MKVGNFLNIVNVFFPISEHNGNSSATTDEGSDQSSEVNIISMPSKPATHVIRYSSNEFAFSNINCFIRLLEENKLIKQFLEFDRCYKLADKFLLAVVFVFFIRARLPKSEYNSDNFFAALYLAHDMEEDDEDLKCQVMRWSLGSSLRDQTEEFLQLRNDIWAAMDYRACVSLQCCFQVIESCENCVFWQRDRSPAHAGARRSYEPDEECSHCYLEHVRFYGSDLDSSDSDDSEFDSGLPAVKRIRLNEE